MELNNMNEKEILKKLRWSGGVTHKGDIKRAFGHKALLVPKKFKCLINNLWEYKLDMIHEYVQRHEDTGMYITSVEVLGESTEFRIQKKEKYLDEYFWDNHTLAGSTKTPNDSARQVG